jgi:hypothetical protein
MVQQLSLSSTNTTSTNTTSTNTTSTNLCAGYEKSVLLQTARACIFNAAALHRSTEVRLLLDSGSQKSYLSERAMKLLELKPVGEQQLGIATFGSSQEHHQAYPVVEVGMRVKGFPPLCLSLYVVPMICKPIVSQPISACVAETQHLGPLELADYSDGKASLEVDALIGCDFYWDLVTGGMSRGIQGPVAIHTKLGWVLSGPVATEGLARSSTNLVTTVLMHSQVTMLTLNSSYIPSGIWNCRASTRSDHCIQPVSLSSSSCCCS